MIELSKRLLWPRLTPGLIYTGNGYYGYGTGYGDGYGCSDDGDGHGNGCGNGYGDG